MYSILLSKKKQFYNTIIYGGINTMILNETYDEILERLDSYSLNEGFFSDRKKKREEKHKEKKKRIYKEI